MLIALLFLSTIVSCSPGYETPVKILNQVSPLINYTHSVFVGIVTAQFCEPCDEWGQFVYNKYNSGDYDFHYVEMITHDYSGQKLNQEADDWRKNYSIYAFPTTVFDNDYERIQGNQQDSFIDTLNSSGERSVADITADMIVSWLGNATIEVEVDIQNNEQTQYSGFIRVYITEIVSRYYTYYGNPYHFGFLDFAFNKEITIDAGGFYQDNVTWNGNEHEDSHGDDFGDIESDNIQLVLEIFNTDNDGYVDETVMARITDNNNPPNAPSDPEPSDGETDVDVNSDLSWTCSDPDDDILTYDVYFGTSNPPQLMVNNQTGNYYDPGTMEVDTQYFWKIIAWDPYGTFNTSSIWSFTTGSEVNFPPDLPSDPSPEDGGTDVDIEQDLLWFCSDPDGDNLTYDVYFEADDTTPDIKVADDQTINTFEPGSLHYSTTYYWKIVAKDEKGASTVGNIWSFTTIINEPPATPIISGPSKGKPGENYYFDLVTTDPEGDDVSYYVEWGDGTSIPWFGPYTSGIEVTVGKAWSKKGTYTIKVKAIDVFNQESDWAEFNMAITKYKSVNSLFQRFFENHPYLYKILQLLL